MNDIREGITYDDVILEPRYSEIVPRETDVSTKLTPNIDLSTPIVSAAMDTVTESLLSIALAQEGGIGIIHKNLSADEQALEVDKVKRSANGVILDPVTLPPDDTIGSARELMAEHNISGVPVVQNGCLVGILTNRDLRFQDNMNRKIKEVMTSKNLVTAPRDTTLEQAKEILHKNKVEKLLLVDEKSELTGLITIKDIDKLTHFPHACRDQRGRLRVGAAVGVEDEERIETLIGKDVDLIVVDTAHGHSRGVVEAVKRLKAAHDIDVVAGNVATKEGAKALIDAGADAVKVGIGPGSICTTRIIAGVGVPQITAILDTVAAAGDAGIPVIADGGIRHSGDITKALAAGASAVMIGSLFAGVDESPGETIIFKGRTFKVYRGMGSIGAMVQGSADRYGQTKGDKLVPEGVEGRIPTKGPLSEFIYQMVGGLRAGMGYIGASNIQDLRQRSRFIRITWAGFAEAHPHNITITREAPNYTLE